MSEYIKKEDYEEPCCPLKSPEPSPIKPIPVIRVMEKLDNYLAGEDYDGAVRHLNYWANEAENGRDISGKLSVVNEQIGLYRKLEMQTECLEKIEEALRLLSSDNYEGTHTQAITFINCASGYKAFNRAKTALPLYEKAKKIFEKTLKDNDGRLGALYNNMALTVAEIAGKMCENPETEALGKAEYQKAEELFEKALHVMEKNEFGHGGRAITYCNMADMVYAANGQPEDADVCSYECESADGFSWKTKVGKYLNLAMDNLTNAKVERDGGFAYILEKCAPTFEYFGYKDFAGMLFDIAAGIRKRYKG